MSSIADLPRQTLLLLVRGYRLLLKPNLGQSCRFEPTCSQYALTALERHGAMLGSALTAGRLLRCHPWCAGGCDDVPAQAPRWFTRWTQDAPRLKSDCASGTRHPELRKGASGLGTQAPAVPRTTAISPPLPATTPGSFKP